MTDRRASVRELGFLSIDGCCCICSRPLMADRVLSPRGGDLRDICRATDKPEIMRREGAIGGRYRARQESREPASCAAPLYQYGVPYME
jgi:hypothetical protein